MSLTKGKLNDLFAAYNNINQKTVTELVAYLFDSFQPTLVKTSILEASKIKAGALTTPSANLDVAAGTTSVPQIILAISPAPTGGALVDGSMWRETNANDGLKFRVNGVTKTVTLS